MICIRIYVYGMSRDVKLATREYTVFGTAQGSCDAFGADLVVFTVCIPVPNICLIWKGIMRIRL